MMNRKQMLSVFDYPEKMWNVLGLVVVRFHIETIFIIEFTRS